MAWTAYHFTDTADMTHELTEQQRTMYDDESWARLVREIGLEPYHTESQAKRVAEHAAKKLDLCHELITRLRKSK